MAQPNDIFHHENIYRGKSVKDLFNKHITVCGVGAIGSNLIDNLTRQGFTRVRAIDRDRVELHNINNQCYTRSQIGNLKVAAMQSIVFSAVGTEIETENKELTLTNVKKLLRKTDLVIDAFDNSASRRILYNYCLDNKVPCLHCGVFEGFGEISWNEKYVVPNNIAEGDACDQPLARNLFLLVVAVATEEVVNFCLELGQRKLYITLKDLEVRKV